MANSDDLNLALFCDFENVALGVRDAKYDRFDINRVLERLLLKGSIVVKKAYCDWERYKEFKTAMHAASFELIEIPHVRQSGKNSADIRMVVDALDLCYTKSHVDTFVIISGDSDFSPLVSKLRENNKTVIGVGVKSSTSDLLINNCDEFIYYDDLVRDQPRRRRAAPRKKAESGGPPRGKPERGGRGGRGRGERTANADRAEEMALEFAPEPAPAAEPPSEPAESVAGSVVPPEDDRDEAGGDRQQQAFDLVTETLDALIAERGAGENVWGSMIKQTLKRRKPGFNEGYYGFRSFNALLEEAALQHLVELERDEKSGGYVVRPATP
jgi:uncharacterized protein (TIGR00288 family)